MKHNQDGKRTVTRGCRRSSRRNQNTETEPEMEGNQDGKRIVEYLRERGWMGEAGVSLLAGVATGLPVYLQGPASSVMGVPSSMIWGGAVAAGAFLLTASLRLIPSR